MADLSSMGRATVLACPQCATVLYEVEEDGVARFRCAYGHAYGPDELFPKIAEDLEGLLPDVVDALTK